MPDNSHNELQGGLQGRLHAELQKDSLSELDRTLLKILAAKVGTDPEKLTEGYRKNGLGSVLSALPDKDRLSVTDILSDPKKAESAKRSAEKAVQSQTIRRILGKEK